MPGWEWGLIALGALLLIYAGFVAGLALVGRRAEARGFARFIPDCVVLFGRLLKDPRLPRSRKLLVLALIGYLAMPFDLIPDFIPVAGQLDDAILVALVLRTVFRGASPDLIRQHWPGPEESVQSVLRLAGQPSRPTDDGPSGELPAGDGLA
jgi:uncharacterized membrane protein YkvA (DUF1232 family)